MSFRVSWLFRPTVHHKTIGQPPDPRQRTPDSAKGSVIYTQNGHRWRTKRYRNPSTNSSEQEERYSETDVIRSTVDNGKTLGRTELSIDVPCHLAPNRQDHRRERGGVRGREKKLPAAGDRGVTYSPWSDDWLRRCIVDAKDSCARCVPKFKYYNGFKGLDANFGRNNFGGWEGYYVVSSDK